MTNCIKTKHVVIYIGLLVLMLALLIIFKVESKRQTGVSWQDYFGDQMLTQKMTLTRSLKLWRGRNTASVCL